MSDEWPDEAVDFVQTIADTKLVLSHRYSERMLSGPALEDSIAGASATQDELGHVRQLFRLLERQGRKTDWLEGERSAEEYHNAPSLDAVATDWTEFVVQTAVTDRAAWLLLDAITHSDFEGMVEKMGEEEYFHLEHHDGWLETLAEDDPERVESAFESAAPAVLSFVGPATFDETADPLVQAGFTDRPATELHEALLEHYETLFEATDVSFSAGDYDAPAVGEWNESRRRTNDETIETDVVESLRGSHNSEFAIQ